MSENIDLLWTSSRPGQPTPAGPGSEHKIRVMIERALRREPLFHPKDGLRSGLRPSLPCLTQAGETTGRMESA
jgi:hypothetical protein